jgi:hypothetical protein
MKTRDVMPAIVGNRPWLFHANAAKQLGLQRSFVFVGLPAQLSYCRLKSADLGFK